MTRPPSPVIRITDRCNNITLSNYVADGKYVTSLFTRLKEALKMVKDTAIKEAKRHKRYDRRTGGSERRTQTFHSVGRWTDTSTLFSVPSGKRL